MTDFLKNSARKAASLLAEGIIVLITLYQATLSSLFPMKCRFTPTCSHYMIGAIRDWGLLKGVLLGIRRMVRCHPLGAWGHDPVPRKKKPRDTNTTT